MAAGFIADTGSIALIVSNLVNIVSADFFGIGFGEYASVMVPVNLMAVASTLAVLLLFFRKSIPPRYDVSQLPAPPRPCATRSRSAPAGSCWRCCWRASSSWNRWASRSAPSRPPARWACC